MISQEQILAGTTRTNRDRNFGIQIMVVSTLVMCVRRSAFVSSFRCGLQTRTTRQLALFASSKLVPAQSFLAPTTRTNPTSSTILYMSSLASDNSSASLSRAPFSMPKDSPDDNISPMLRDSKLNWSELGLLDELATVVYDKQGLSNPTPVQKSVIPAILGLTSAREKNPAKQPQSIVFAAATGSGKTLAYVLPILQQLKTAEMAISSNNKQDDADENAPTVDSTSTGTFWKPKRPRALILAPTRELAHQILSVVKSISHFVKLSSVLLVGGEDYGIQRKKLDKPIDVVVATPGRLVKHLKDSHIFLGSVQYVVIDEMDTMLDQGFQDDLAKLLHPLMYDRGQWTVRPTSPHLIMTSATMTRAVKRLIGLDSKDSKGKEQPLDPSAIRLPTETIRTIELPGLHRVVPRLRQVFVDVGKVDKLSLLVDAVHQGSNVGSAMSTSERTTLESISRKQPLTLVFCNTVSSCRAAEHALAEAGINSLCYHGELNSAQRFDNLQIFRASGEGDVVEDPCTVLVCTDIAARGLDVPQVDHVVMFDFPLNPIDYLHRAGRTARGINQRHGTTNALLSAGNGRVTALVAKRDQVLAKAIEVAVQKGDPLDELTSRKEDYLPGGIRGAPASKRSVPHGDERRRTNRANQPGGVKIKSKSRRSTNNKKFR